MDGVIKAHCMGMEFPKRDTDSPGIKWAYFEDAAAQDRLGKACRRLIELIDECLPTAADLDAVAEEQRVKEKTSAQVPNR